MISGAFKSINLFNLLFLLITLLYKSFKSDVANLPPSSGTKGLSSGGMTGTVVKIIHSGLFSDEINDSISFNLLIVLSSVTLDLISFKLKEIQNKDKLLLKGMKVLDLGSSPGGWSQVTKEIIGAAGKIVAVDLKDMQEIKGVIFVKKDIGLIDEEDISFLLGLI